MKFSHRYILTFLLGAIIFSSCEDKIDRRDMYTFTGQMATDYINATPNLSMFAKLLTISKNSTKKNSSKVSSLLGTRGHYTVFAPTNEGVKLYLDSIYGKNNYIIDTISQEVADKIVLNSIIDNGIENDPMMVMNLYEGGMVEGTLNDHHMMVRFGDWGDNAIARINNCSRIIKGDIEVKNGYVHIVDKVIVPGPSTLPGLIGQTPDFRIFSMLMNITSWDDSLSIYEDHKYNDSIYHAFKREHTSIGSTPLIRYRLFRFTAFVETDDVFQTDWGVPELHLSPETGSIENKEEIMAVINQKCKEIYPEATSPDYTSENNAVNQFVSYHFLPSQNKYNWLTPSANPTTQFGYPHKEYIYQNLWKKHGPTDRWQYFATMGHPRRILKTTYSVNKEATYLNRHCLYDNTYEGDYHETACTREGILVYPDKGEQENAAPNGCYYRINHILSYNNDIRNHVLNERIRYSVPQNIPELINFGNYEELWEVEGKYNSGSNLYIPSFFCKDIISKNDYLHLGKSRKVIISDGNTTISIPSSEITIKILPVPFEGIWEVRIPSWRGIYKLYFGDSPYENHMTQTRLINNFQDNHETRLPWDIPVRYDHQSDNSRVIDYYLGYNPVDSIDFIEHDHTARKKGFMYLPHIFGKYIVNTSTYYYWCPNRFLNTFAKRIIVYRGYMDPKKDYYIKIKFFNNGEKTFYGQNLYGAKDYTGVPFTYIELVPENIYAGNRHEDWW